MNTALLLLGSNIGSREEALLSAVSAINENAGKVMMKSPVYETDPWGNMNQKSFLNQAIIIETVHPAADLLKILLGIEEEMGRRRMVKWEPRIIDIDILFFNNDIINDEGLTIPHPLLHERMFTLKPLMDIQPNLIHPVFKKTITELYNESNDNQDVIIYNSAIK